MSMTGFIFRATMLRSRASLCAKYGEAFWREFSERSRRALAEDRPKVVDIGDSVFSFNYQFGPCYVAWYKAFKAMGVEGDDEIGRNIWIMSERFVSIIPRPLLHATGKAYFRGFRKKAGAHVRRQEEGALHPWDWEIAYRDVDTGHFEIDIFRCAIKRLASELGAPGLLPWICRMDYLFSSLMGNGFSRTKTLGDGDDRCDCRYAYEGRCEWAPEKGFADRK